MSTPEIRPVVSIIICTRNHASALKPTLASLAELVIPQDLATELIIADNGSTDDTAQVVEAATPSLTNLAGGVHRVVESRGGQCFARNAGIAASRGDIILFTDDDLRFPKNWVEAVCRPILNGEADAVVGGVTLAPYLQRPWMTPYHRTWMTSTERHDRERPDLVGASMAFGRHVLEKVPSFDTELGPGALGFGDDTLFSAQLREAGFRIAARLDVAVEHHCDADRVLRSAFLSSAAKHGRSAAYRAYHWQHDTFRYPALRALRASLLLALQRRRHAAEIQGPEGMPEWEMNAIQFVHFCRQWQIESRRPRLYDHLGLRKKPI